MAPAPLAPSTERASRLAAALRDLGPQVRRGAAPEAFSGRCATRVAALDRLLGGGFPRGALSEVAGPPSSGRTSLVLALLAAATAGGELAGLVDAADAFDPPSAAAAGVALGRLLWVRPPDLATALRSAEHLLAAGGFGVVALDLAAGGAAAARGAPAAAASAGSASAERAVRERGRRGGADVAGARTWLRLRQAACGSGTAFVVVADARLAEGFADLALELAPAALRFEGVAAPGEAAPGAEGAYLAALESEVRLVRSRAGGPLRCAPARWPQRGAA